MEQLKMTNRSVVDESAQYDNYLDKTKRAEDEYSASLDNFFDEPVKTVLLDETKSKKVSHDFKSIYVHFRNVDDLADFCMKIGQVVPRNSKDVYYPLHDPDASLFDEPQSALTSIDKSLLIPKKQKTKSTASLDIDVEAEGVNKIATHWKEMPSFVQEEKPPFRSITLKFRKEAHYKEFAERIEQDLSDSTKSIWHPKLEVPANYQLRWVEHETHTLPRYPVYIISKGRHESMFTSRSLSRMRIPHYIAIEPQDEQNYEEALDNFGIRDYVTLLILPFSNHGDGPGRARNWCWDHSIHLGFERHWVCDDNITDFYRLHENLRVRVESGSFFRPMEDFCDRYENVKIAGPQYRFFCADKQKYPPFVTNTRIYSCLLIDNNCQHRWRGRYNEDTDICLRVMKDGDCTVQFNAFLQGKGATQTLKGGNTEEFYHKEIGLDENGIAIKADDLQVKERYNTSGTIAKSQMLVDMHPDVTKLVWRYGRWHHHVDYGPFKANKLIFKEGINLSDTVNNYNLEFIDNWEEYSLTK